MHRFGMTIRQRAWRTGVALMAAVGWVAACTPAWNWRQMSFPAANVRGSFPCKPEIRQERGTGLAVCEAQGWTFSLAWQDLERGDRVLLALEVSASDLAGRLGAQATPLGPEAGLQPPIGALPTERGGAFHLKAPERQAVLLTWGRRGHVYQALVLGREAPPPTALQFLRELTHLPDESGRPAS
ncbi:hypothetical protein [Inhella gelatinilytica]|uniref:Uncharacterized protein n=1 Tax=Inhella gelatinilytica TaxID=2795030 RepID=A0A931J203_9BURK|nr:hypothetical protein [Inhella gelatinilytica]MBH9553891.1 hypothetical protein [Inhella gelatinilytica]